MLTPTQEKIIGINDAIKEFLLEKNRRYGNSALEPIDDIKYTPIDGIKIRLCDKLKRIINSDEIRCNDIVDTIGYLELLLIANNVNKNNILKLID